MLLVFLFANTPKRLLHNLVADHTDTVNKRDDGQDKLRKSSFYCQWDHLVATSPFTETDEKPGIIVPLFFFTVQHGEVQKAPYQLTGYSSLRGPPVNI